MSGSVFLAEIETWAAETAGTIQIEIRRTGSLAGEVTILYGVQGDTATPGLDYIAPSSGSVVMPDGAASVFVPITILDDALGEGTETLTFALISATGATLTAPRTNRISILDDETPSPPPPAEPPLISDWIVTREPTVGGLATPVRFSFSPNDPNLVFVAEKAGIVKLANIATGQTQTVLDLRTTTNSAGDRGLLDVLAHPDLANHPYLYVFRVVEPPEAAGLSGNAGLDGAGNRYSHLERYTLDAATDYTTVVAGSRVVILGNAGDSTADIRGGGALDFTNPAHAAELSSERLTNAGDFVVNGYKQNYLKGDSLSHNGGKLLFGPDGMLYVLTGDATSYNYADPRTPEVQSLDTLSGKVLRIDPITGQGLADNPFAGDAVSLDANRAKIWQYGLRNPFSAVFDSEGKLLIADVGWDTYEEINTAGPGANFGWPFYEGGDGTLHRTNGYRDLPGAAAFYDAVAAGDIVVTLPFRAFHHADSAPGFQVQSITSGGVILPGTVYDDSLIGRFIFSDFVGGDTYIIHENDRLDVRYLFDWGEFGPVHMVQGPDGYIHYADLFDGTIGRLSITPAPAPEAQVLATLGAASAVAGSPGEFLLNPAQPNALGAVGSPTRIDLRADARFAWQMNFGDNDAGADGGAFVLHRAGWGALGSSGGGLGVAGLGLALAVEFDTWQNDGSEPALDHTVIYAPGNPGFGTGVNGVVTLGNIEDGLWHSIEIVWTAATRTLTTFFDGIQRDTLVSDLTNTLFQGSPFVNFMITGSTGGALQAHRMRDLVADVTYEDVAGNQAPVLFGGPLRTFQVAENTVLPFHTPFATDAEGDTLAWSIAGGADGARFAIDPATGAIRFAVWPDYEAPTDANGDNIYEVTIRVSDPGGRSAQQALRVQVTDVAQEELVGTAGDDVIFGLPGANDVIIGLAGNDTVWGLDGADTIVATVNDGNDFYSGGSGGMDVYDISLTSANAIIAITGGQASSAEIGADTLRSIEHAVGGAGDDLITGNAGWNRLIGGGGADTLRGLDGDDQLYGGAGDDSLHGGLGADEMHGGAGNDIYRVDDADDLIFELPGEGADTVLATISFTAPAEIEQLILQGTGNIRGTGNALDNRIVGNAGNNLLQGMEGADSLAGGLGNDTLEGGAGADTLNGGAGNDVFRYAAPGHGGDRIVAYVAAEDQIQVSAAGFGGGLAAGMNLVALGRYVANNTGLATAPEGVGQFIYNTANATLYYDADGSGAGAAVMIAFLPGNNGFNGSEITVIA